MISRKPRDSLTKVPGRTGKFGSRPLDLDLVAQIRWDLDLIVRVQIKSDGSDRKGSTAAARVAGKLLPAAAPRRRGSNPVFQVTKWLGFGLGGNSVACVTHLGLQNGGLGLGARYSTAMAAPGGESRRCWRGPAPTVRQGQKHLAKKGWRGLGCLPRFGPGEGVTQVVPAARSGNGRGRRFAVRVAAVVLRAY